MTCNVHGVMNDCNDQQCVCKEGYFGDLCEYCSPPTAQMICTAVDNSMIEGEVDMTSGEGIHCSCELDFLES